MGPVRVLLLLLRGVFREGKGMRLHLESCGFVTTKRQCRRAPGITQLAAPGPGATERLNRCRIEFLRGTNDTHASEKPPNNSVEEPPSEVGHATCQHLVEDVVAAASLIPDLGGPVVDHQ